MAAPSGCVFLPIGLPARVLSIKPAIALLRHRLWLSSLNPAPMSSLLARNSALASRLVGRPGIVQPVSRAVLSTSRFGLQRPIDRVWPCAVQKRSISSFEGLDFNKKNALPLNTIIKFVPQQQAWIVERMGKFHRILEPGLAILVPFLDSIRYVKTLKEVAVEIPTQSAITQDNVTLQLDGVLYYKIIDPYKASYGVEDSEFAITQLAQTTMRAEIGQITLDRTLAERTHLNAAIVHSINIAAADWGIQCLRYEIKDIHPPENVVAAMHQQVSAERRKRAEILESEGSRQATINIAEGQKQSVILESEANKARQINDAAGEAESIMLKATAAAQSLDVISKAIQNNGQNGQDAIALTVAEKYIDSFGRLAKEGNTVIVPSNVGDAAGMVAQMMAIFGNVKNIQSKNQLDSRSRD
ncbi:stomatin family protein [Polychytrium aggregatum]|uniref:stomatin family protein n=1 Tax=Polychytrium aggregatum TaxID=110093 RepID=UPI0022FE6BDD|nr:stomatin family protein [Polychytrium aggregatum]KAI9202926.1 stomatin family protein [Polychytrium aggregatum]